MHRGKNTVSTRDIQRSEFVSGNCPSFEHVNQCDDVVASGVNGCRQGWTSECVRFESKVLESKVCCIFYPKDNTSAVGCKRGVDTRFQGGSALALVGD